MSLPQYTVVLSLDDWRTIISLAWQAVDQEDNKELKDSYLETIKVATRQLGWGPY